MSNVLLEAVRCDCGSRLQWGTEQTERGPRWTFTCERCGCRWRHRDGVFGPLDREPGDRSVEQELLAWFRCLPEELRSEAISCLRALALSAAGASAAQKRFVANDADF